MRLTTLGLAAAALLTSAAPAFAQAQVDKEDARCVLIMNLLAQDAQQKPQASTALFYFIGRLDGRGSTAKLESLLVSERKALDGEEAFKAELTRCGEVMAQRSTALNAMYTRLAAAEEKANPKPAAPAAAAPAKPPAK